MIIEIISVDSTIHKLDVTFDTPVKEICKQLSELERINDIKIVIDHYSGRWETFKDIHDYLLSKNASKIRCDVSKKSLCPQCEGTSVLSYGQELGKGDTLQMFGGTPITKYLGIWRCNNCWKRNAHFILSLDK